ncbi:MAG TPA: hypothetical protein VGQ83_39920 [Polyangia bacterium]
MRQLLIAALLALAGGCTVATPGYCGAAADCPAGAVCDLLANRCLADTTGCADREDGLRACTGDRAASGVCAGGVIIADRACAADALCRHGWCTPAHEQSCQVDRDCGAEGACGAYRGVSGAARLACGGLVGAGGPAESCAAEAPALACRSGLCDAGRCLQLCVKADDCGASRATCAPATLAFEGVTMTVTRCVP